MSAWKSRWSCVRLVKTAADQWIASARCRESAWLETSMTTASSPAASMSAKVRCRSMASGVVRATACCSPPTIAVTVPSRPVRRPPASSRARTRKADRRLAVGARDPDRGQPRGRVAGQRGGGGRHRGAHVVDEDLGHGGAQRPLHDERHRAARDRVAGVVVAVAREARHAEEQRARRHEAVVVGERRDLDRGRVGADDVCQQHGPGAYCGGMRMYGRAKEAILPKAGAATTPP